MFNHPSYNIHTSAHTALTLIEQSVREARVIHAGYDDAISRGLLAESDTSLETETTIEYYGNDWSVILHKADNS